MIFLPIALILVACAAAAGAAFGTHPGWTQFDQGMEVIYLARRMQWLLVGLSVVSCMGLIVVAVTDRKRAGWLAGLLPVLGLLAFRFAPGRVEDLAVVEDPAFVEIDKADFVKDDDWVVALRLGDKAFAYPYAALYVEPAVIQTEHDKRMALFWNAEANRVVALQATPEFRGRDLDVVGTPAGSLLVYNTRVGQFICGVTGQTPERTKPTGLGAPIATNKMTFGRWRLAAPTGRVMKPSPRAQPLTLMAPTQPSTASVPVAKAEEAVPAKHSAARPATLPTGHRRATIVGISRPMAVEVTTLGLAPSFIQADDQSAVLLRTDLRGSGLKAFSRKLDEFVLRLQPKKDAKLADVRMADTEVGALWSSAGVAIGGTPQFRGRRLQPLPVDEDVDLEVMKRWMPEIEVFAERAAATVEEPKAVEAKKPEKRPAHKPASPKSVKGKPPVEVKAK